MNSDPRITAARAFVRSLNILLKLARLYSFDHARTAAQFDTAWSELTAAIAGGGQGLLLGASGSQLLLDGAPIEAAPAERSFALLLSVAGVASIQFAHDVKREDLERLTRAFPTSNTKASALAEQLKAALASTTRIRINEIRFVAEDASVSETRAAQLTAGTLGADANSMKDWLRDPQKLLQLIAAAEGSRGGSGAGPASSAVDKIGSGPGSGTVDAGAANLQPVAGGGMGFGNSGLPGGAGVGTGGAPGGSGAVGGGLGAGNAGVSGLSAGKPGAASSIFNIQEQDLLGILKLLTNLCQSLAGEGGAAPGPLHEEISKLPRESHQLLQEALAALAAQAPRPEKNDPVLLRLAEHLAIRFALERYQRGEVKVNAIREMLDRMSHEIVGLRKMLGAHEEKMAQSGIAVESHADLLDRQFWASVPDSGKKAVLCSHDAWCIPARNVKQYVEDLLRQGNEPQAALVLQNYAECLGSEETEARRRIAIGLSDLAELYAAVAGGRLLAPAIRVTGARVGLEREESLQSLVSAAFVRLAQEGGARKNLPAMIQALNSLDAIEDQRPTFAQSLQPRIGFEKRVPEFLAEVVRSGHPPAELGALLQRLPRAGSEHLVQLFNRTLHCDHLQRLVDLALAIGPEAAVTPRDTLRTAPPAEAAEQTGFLSRLDPESLARWLPDRLGEWPRNAQDRMVRLVAMGGAPERGQVLAALLDKFDPLLLPLVVDEIGFSADSVCVTAVLRLAESDDARRAGPFVRLKAVEALGRLKAAPATEFLRHLVEARQMFRWTYPAELRLAALQSLAKIDPSHCNEILARSGFSGADLNLVPLDPRPNPKWFRARRYPRIRLKAPIAAVISTDHETLSLEIRGLSLSGGIAIGAKHLPPSSLFTMKLGSALRPIRARVFMRDARAQGLGFEFADMDLDERARLRKLLLEHLPAAAPSEVQVVSQ